MKKTQVFISILFFKNHQTTAFCSLAPDFSCQFLAKLAFSASQNPFSTSVCTVLFPFGWPGGLAGPGAPAPSEGSVPGGLEDLRWWSDRPGPSGVKPNNWSKDWSIFFKNVYMFVFFCLICFLLFYLKMFVFSKIYISKLFCYGSIVVWSNESFVYEVLWGLLETNTNTLFSLKIFK